MRDLKMTTQREIDEQTAMNAKFKRGLLAGTVLLWGVTVALYVAGVPFNTAVATLPLVPIGLLFILKA